MKSVMSAMGRACLLGALGAALGLLPSACGGRPVPARAGRTPPLVELMSWWLAPGEAEALQSLIQAHSVRCPKARVFNSVAASSDVSLQMAAERLPNGDPPDLMQLNSRELREVLRRHPGSLDRLDGLADELGLRSVAFPEALQAMTVDGHLMAIPVNVHRENTLFFNKALFAAHNLTPPKSVPELLNVCRRLKAAGVTPIATAHQGWIVRMMLNALVVGEMGGAAYSDFFERRGEEPVEPIRRAISALGEILQRYTNPDAAEEGFGWTHAAQTIFNGDAAMLLHGDWAKGYLVQLGWRPGIDFGAVGSPGAADLVLYLSDGLALPAGAANRVAARDFLTTAASKAGQVAFNSLKGSSSIRRDIGVEVLDPLARVTFDDLQQARFRVPALNSAALDDAAVRFARDGDGEALLRALIASRP